MLIEKIKIGLMITVIHNNYSIGKANLKRVVLHLLLRIYWQCGKLEIFHLILVSACRNLIFNKYLKETITLGVISPLFTLCELKVS